jgi:hypothetical protein
MIPLQLATGFVPAAGRNTGVEAAFARWNDRHDSV